VFISSGSKIAAAFSRSLDSTANPKSINLNIMGKKILKDVTIVGSGPEAVGLWGCGAMGQL
jgi:hypothetical protein